MLVKEGARRCPSCSLAVVKDGGCPQMFCMNCNRGFWWETAELVTAAPPKKPSPRKKAVEPPARHSYVPPPVECEIDGIERRAREQDAEAAASGPSQPAAPERVPFIIHGAHPHA